MNSQFAFLCEAANISANNLFNVLGGGIVNLYFKELPQRQALTLLLRIEYNSVIENGKHLIEIRLVDGDGRDKILPLSLEVDFPAQGRFFNFITSLIPTFDVYGPHSVEISVDRHSISSIPLNIISAEVAFEDA